MKPIFYILIIFVTTLSCYSQLHKPNQEDKNQYKNQQLIENLIKQNKNIILLGKPGSGKGSISQEIRKHEYVHIGLGDTLRSRYHEKGKTGKMIRKAIDNGEWLSDDFCARLLYNKAVNAKLNNKKFILEGFPITPSQVKTFAKIFLENNKIDPQNLIFITLDIDDETAIERIKNRLVCPRCGLVYNKEFLSKNNGIYKCKHCGAKLQVRKEDISIDRIKNRIVKFNENINSATKHLRNYFTKSKFITIKAKS